MSENFTSKLLYQGRKTALLVVLSRKALSSSMPACVCIDIGQNSSIATASNNAGAVLCCQQ